MFRSEESQPPATRTKPAGDARACDTRAGRVTVPLRRWDLAYVDPVPATTEVLPQWVVVRADGTRERYPLAGTTIVAAD